MNGNAHQLGQTYCKGRKSSTQTWHQNQQLWEKMSTMQDIGNAFEIKRPAT